SNPSSDPLRGPPSPTRGEGNSRISAAKRLRIQRPAKKAPATYPRSRRRPHPWRRKPSGATPMSDTAEPPAQRRAPDEVWARVREDYLSGLSAPACCRKHGVGLTALRDRAAREGWRRADQPWRPPGLDPDDEGVFLEE